MPPSRKKTRPSKNSKPITAAGFPLPSPTTEHVPRCIPPTRHHASSYHYPLLLLDTKEGGDGKGRGEELLSWFKERKEERCMPWRKEWVDPKRFEGKEGELGEVLGKRAYEVWVSEIMLQQTRVSTVIPYFNTWISKWPTIQDLALATHDDVLSAWKGLGYYSRATRLHEGAKAMVSQSSSSESTCPIPSTADALQQFPGIGRYTAGAVSSIAFGVAEPVLDGNVVRVLSRQLGLYADGKDKKISDKLWEVADQLVKHVSRFPEVQRSAVPGQWNQALMELGSTVCTPRPKCGECPIQRTCRAYAEGVVLADRKRGKKGADDDEEVVDIEDACTLCEQLDTEDLVTATPPSDAEDDSDAVAPPPPSKRRKLATAEPKKPVNTISNYFSIRTRRTTATIATPTPTTTTTQQPPEKPSSRPNLAPIQTYTSLFPKKPPKKAPAEQSAVICLIQLPPTSSTTNPTPTPSSKFLIQQRPAKGLLASLWQFPQHILPPSEPSTPSSRREAAEPFVRDLLLTHPPDDGVEVPSAVFVKEVGSLLHVFSHLKLTMHVLVFRVGGVKEEEETTTKKRKPSRERGVGEEEEEKERAEWVPADEVQHETLSTGMRRCWDMFCRDG